MSVYIYEQIINHRSAGRLSHPRTHYIVSKNKNKMQNNFCVLLLCQEHEHKTFKHIITIKKDVIKRKEFKN